MLELAMAATRCNQVPAVVFDQPDRLTYLHTLVPLARRRSLPMLQRQRTFLHPEQLLRIAVGDAFAVGGGDRQLLQKRAR